MKLSIVLLMLSLVLGYIAFNHVYAWAGVFIPVAGVVNFVFQLNKYLKSILNEK